MPAVIMAFTEPSIGEILAGKSYDKLLAIQERNMKKSGIIKPTNKQKSNVRKEMRFLSE